MKIAIKTLYIHARPSMFLYMYVSRVALHVNVFFVVVAAAVLPFFIYYFVGVNSAASCQIGIKSVLLIY